MSIREAWYAYMLIKAIASSKARALVCGENLRRIPNAEKI